jgi:hypothetical protein
MPVPQAGTATTVASTGTYDVARFGIEDGVCGKRRRSSTPGPIARRTRGRCGSACAASVFDSRIRNLHSQIPDCGRAGCEFACAASVFDPRIRNLHSQIPDCGQAGW